MKRYLMMVAAVALAVAGVAGPASAQQTVRTGAASLISEDPELLNVPEVERGFYLHANAGGQFFFGKLGKWLSPSLVAGIGLGYDILDDYLSIELDSLVGVSSGSVYQQVMLEQGLYAPYPDALVDGSNLNVSGLLSLRARLPWISTKRLWPYVKVGGGVYYGSSLVDGYSGPRYNEETGELIPSDAEYTYQWKKRSNKIDFLVGGGLGVEYFTWLRHFSVALGIDVHYLIGLSSIALNVFPSVRYTF